MILIRDILKSHLIPSNKKQIGNFIHMVYSTEPTIEFEMEFRLNQHVWRRKQHD